MINLNETRNDAVTVKWMNKIEYETSLPVMKLDTNTEIRFKINPKKTAFKMLLISTTDVCLRIPL